MDIKELVEAAGNHADSSEVVVYNEVTDSTWAIDDCIDDNGQLCLILREETS